MTSPTGSTIAYADGAIYKMGITDVTLYARWIKKVTFALTITATNGSVTKSPNAAVYDSGSTVDLKATANTGYKFVNWSGDASGTTDSTVVIINKETNVTANFSPIPYTITFSSRGTTYSIATVNYNALAAEPATPQGGTCDTFSGWYTSGTYAAKWNFSADKVTSDTTLFAKWSQRTYLITYNSNGAASGTPPAQQIKTCDSAITLASNSGNLAKTGVTFAGWNTTTDGTGTDYAQGVSYTANAPLALFAKWKTDSLLVTFNSNDGSSVASKMVIYGGYVTEPTAPTKAGFAFAGWYSNQSLTTPFDFPTAITVARTLYAKWNPVYRVVYSANSGTGPVPVDNNEYQNGQIVTLLAKPSGLTRQYYDFVGWNTSSNGTGTNRLPGTTFQIGSKNDTLYANWKVALPVITVQPASTNPYPLDNISFTVTAEGIGLSYQWQKNETNIPTANSAILTKQKVAYPDSGYFRCVVSNSSGSTVSSYAKLAIRTNVKDADSNEYKIIVIGTQVWTIENLRTTRYNDGTIIPHVTDETAWSNLLTPSYCFYDNSTISSEKEKWGALYNWYAVNTGKLTPKGWRVPSEDDWETLENYLVENGYNWDGTNTGNKIAKSLSSKNTWNSYDEAGTVGNDFNKNNTSGFSALPAGYRLNYGGFGGQSDYGNWWSSSEVEDVYSRYRLIGFSSIDFSSSINNKGYGFSVRMLKE